MPSLSFQKQFVPGIRAMLSKDYSARLKVKPKHTTIRGYRKRPFKKGDRLILFFGLRTKNCEKLGEVCCRKVEDIGIEIIGKQLIIVLNNKTIREDAIQQLAENDGFENGEEMVHFLFRVLIQ